jgi:hypothetical protein
MIVTASLTTGVARVARGMTDAVRLIDEILRMDHAEWETTLFIGDVESHRTKDGPFPNHQLRISVHPSDGLAAINYMDHDDPLMPIANSFSQNVHHRTSTSSSAALQERYFRAQPRYPLARRARH